MTKKDGRRSGGSPLTGSVIVVAVCFLCAGCLMALPVVADNPVEKAELPGTEWNLDSYVNSTDGMNSVLEDTDVTLKFGEDGRIAGSAGCNNYFASYETNGGKLSFGPAGCTMMAGPENVMAQEGAFLGLLSSVAGYEIQGDRLTLTDSDGKEILFFSEAVPPVDRPLTGTDWVLDSYNNGNEAVVSVIAGTEITAVFDEESRVAGSAGCNNYFASYELDGEKLSVGPAGSTMMAGPEDVMEQEGAFLGLLGSVAGYEIDGNRLILTDADGREILVFSGAVPPVDRPLTGTNWVLDSYNDGNEAIVSLIAGTEITAVFDEDGRVAGSAGCNNYFASYETDGDKLSVGTPGSTRMAGPDDVMEQESTFLTTLESVAGYEIDGNSLTLQNSSGETVLTFSAGE